MANIYSPQKNETVVTNLATATFALAPSFLSLEESARKERETYSYNPRGFLLDSFKAGPRHVSRDERDLAATREKAVGLILSPNPIFWGYVYLRRRRGSIGRAMAVGAEVARRGIETYLLAQLAPVQHRPPLSNRRNFRRPPSWRANFRAREIRTFLKSVLVAVNLIPTTSMRAIARAPRRQVLPLTYVKNVSRRGTTVHRRRIFCFFRAVLVEFTSLFRRDKSQKR